MINQGSTYFIYSKLRDITLIKDLNISYLMSVLNGQSFMWSHFLTATSSVCYSCHAQNKLQPHKLQPHHHEETRVQRRQVTGRKTERHRNYISLLSK